MLEEKEAGLESLRNSMEASKLIASFGIFKDNFDYVKCFALNVYFIF